MMEDFRKIIIEFNLCKKIIKNKTDIINELNIISIKLYSGSREPE